MKKYYLTIAFSLFMLYLISVCIDVTQKERGWWTGYYKISDWRNKQCDYATDKVVHNYYNESKADWFRYDKFDSLVIRGQKDNYMLVFPKEIEERLIKERKEIIIGVDRYILSPPVVTVTNDKGKFEAYATLLPFKYFTPENINRLKKGDVLRIKFEIKEENILYSSLIN